MSAITRLALITVVFLVVGTFSYFFKEYVVFAIPLGVGLSALAVGVLLWKFSVESLFDADDILLVYSLSFLLTVGVLLYVVRDFAVVPACAFVYILTLAVRKLYYGLKPYLEETER